MVANGESTVFEGFDKLGDRIDDLMKLLNTDGEAGTTPLKLALSAHLTQKSAAMAIGMGISGPEWLQNVTALKQL